MTRSPWPVLRSLVRLVAALLVLSSTRASGATPEPRDFVVNLDGAAQAPAHVCVVSRAAEGKYAPFYAFFDADGVVSNAQAKAAQDVLRQADECGRRGDAAMSAEDAGVGPNPFNDYQVICRSNSQPGGSTEQRVLVLSVRSTSENTPPNVTGVELNGRTAVLHVQGVPASGAVIVNAAGGHYLDGFSRATSGPPLALPLLPRCGSHRLALPRFSGPLTVELRRGSRTAPPAPLTVTAGRIVVPYSADGGPWWLSATVANAKGSSTFEFESTETLPPLVITPRLTQLAFAWTPPPAYAWHECPAVTLAETGTTCAPESPLPVPAKQCILPKQKDPEKLPFSQLRTSDCHYTCPIPSNAEGRVPVGLRFAACGDEQWEDRVGELGKPLRSYVAPSQRSLRLLLDANWPALDDPKARIGKPGVRIDYVEVRAAGAATYRVVPKGTTRLRVPGVEVGDYISYRPIGDREFTAVTERVRPGGELELKAPHTLIEDAGSLGIVLGGGWMPPPIGQVSTGGVWRQYGALELVLGFHWLVRWRGSRWFHPDVELRTGIMIGEQWFQGIAPNPSGSEPSDKGVQPSIQARVPLTANLVFQMADNIYLGFGAGPVVSFPWKMQERSRVKLETAAMVQGLVGWRAARAFALELGTRGVWPEHLLVYSADLSSGAAPRAKEVTSLVVLLPEVRLRADF